MSNLGGACKSMQYFCTYCDCQSGDHDILGYVTGDEVCAMCIRNARKNSAHPHVNDEPKLRSKGRHLLKELVNNYKHRSCNDSATLRHMLPLEPLDCFAQYDEDLKKVTEKKSP